MNFTRLGGDATGDPEDQWKASSNWYLEAAEALLEELADAVADLRPDLVVHEPVDLAGSLVAQSLESLP